MNTTASLRTQALRLAARGWYVFPITPYAKKEPVIKQWETRASTNPDQITSWWQHTPHSIGIATGPSGLVVIDLDTPKPGEPVPDRWANGGITSGAGVLRSLARAQRTTITPTWTVRTPSGGWHLYYTTPATGPRTNPPSNHPCSPCPAHRPPGTAPHPPHSRTRKKTFDPHRRST